MARGKTESPDFRERALAASLKRQDRILGSGRRRHFRERALAASLKPD
jgi:hypothetical protein